MKSVRYKKNATIKDIAVQCGISPMTVSRALRGMEGVSESKRAVIQQTAKDLNYVLNSNARSLVNTSSDLVGISFPSLFNDVFADMLEGMKSTFEKAGISTVVNTTNYSQQAEADWVSRLMSWRPAGIVLTGVNHTKFIRRSLRAIKIPTVEIWDVTDDPIEMCVGVDQFESGCLLARHTVLLGYRRPAHVGSPYGIDPRADQRRDGIINTFADVPNASSMKFSIQQYTNSYEAGYLAAMELCSGAIRPDVIFFVNDHLAIGGIAACQKLGISVPRDIGIVGFNGLDVSSVFSPKLTTAITPRQRIGEVAAGELIKRVNNVKVAIKTVLPVHLESGETTRPQA